MMSVLAQGVPLTLLLDLAATDGPESSRIFARETADLSWLAGLPGSLGGGPASDERRATGTDPTR